MVNRSRHIAQNEWALLWNAFYSHWINWIESDNCVFRSKILNAHIAHSSSLIWTKKINKYGNIIISHSLRTTNTNTRTHKQTDRHTSFIITNDKNQSMIPTDRHLTAHTVSPSSSSILYCIRTRRYITSTTPSYSLLSIVLHTHARTAPHILHALTDSINLFDWWKQSFIVFY